METNEKATAIGFGSREREEARRLIALALAEDLPGPDITTEALIPAGARILGAFVPRVEGVACGIPVVRELFEAIDRRIVVRPIRSDGDRVPSGARILEIAGPARGILAGERSALNFIQRLSGIATAARRWKEALGQARVLLLDTRKTIPGWRHLEKYAVRAGGAGNHRFSLSDAALVKDNHIQILRALKAGGFREWVAAIRGRTPWAVVEVEVEGIEEFREALAAGADIILLDNMPPEAMAQAVKELEGRPGPRPLLEASGGIGSAALRAVASTGVDRISAGALTHSATALDIGFDLLEVSCDDDGA